MGRGSTMQEITEIEFNNLTKDRNQAVNVVNNFEWSRYLANEDIEEFADELFTSSFQDVHELINDWHFTAEALMDPLSREILLGDKSSYDYVEVSRPEKENIETLVHSKVSQSPAIA
jgi:hypothetical protein